MSAHRAQVLSRYKELLRLVGRLPEQKREQALREARDTVRSRQAEGDPQRQLDHLRELVSRIGYLRITTPREPGEAGSKSGVYVVRDGRLVEGSGAGRGSRCVLVERGVTGRRSGRRRSPCPDVHLGGTNGIRHAWGAW